MTRILRLRSMSTTKTKNAMILRLCWVGVLLAVLPALNWGVSGPFPRSYASWSGAVLVNLLDGQNAVPSPIAPVAWSGQGPLTVTDLPLRAGSRLELKLRANEGRVPVQVIIDGRPVDHLQVRPAWRSYRLWLEGDGSILRLEQSGRSGVPIHIARIKVTNVAGFSEGLLNAWIVRRTLPVAPAPHDASWKLLLAILGVAGIVLVVPSTFAPLSLGAYRRCAAGVLVIGAALAAGQLLAAALGFRLIFTPGTAAAILLLPPAAIGGSSLVRRVRVPKVSLSVAWQSFRTLLVVGGVIALWVMALVVLVAGRFDGDIRGVARFGWKFGLSPAMTDVPELSRSGYDGQFYATLASDPFLRDPATVRCLDNPTYRGTRCLIPLLAWASVGGSARLGPFAYVVWCWVLGLAGPAIVLLWLGAFRWRLLLFALLAINAGLVVSLMRATPDAAALAVMLAALLVADRSRRPAVTAVGGTLSVLARETSALAVPGLVWPQLQARQWKRAAVMALAPVLAVGSWRLYVRAVTHRGAGSAWGNFGAPFAWLPEKLSRLRAAGWEHGKVEWIGVAWVLLLIGVAVSYLVRRRTATPALVTFLLFAALAVMVNMRVYTEVNAYSRVLIALPFLAAVLAAEEQQRWRRGLLIAGVVLASVQGGLLLRSEVGHAWHALRRRGGLHLRTSRLADLRISGARVRVGAEWHIPPGRRVQLAAMSGTRSVGLTALSGEARVRRGDRTLLPLGAGESVTLPVRRGGRGLELVGKGQDGALLGPLTSARSTAEIPPIATLLPVVVGRGGCGGTRWLTRLVLKNDAGRPQRVNLTFLPRTGDGSGRAWTEITLRPGRDLTLEDLVPARFGVHSAGALLVASTDPAPSIRCMMGHRTREGVS